MKETSYEPLIAKDSQCESQRARSDLGLQFSSSKAPLFKRRSLVPWWLIACFMVLQAFTITLLIRGGLHGRCSYPNAQILYSPAQEAVEYKAVKFHSGLEHEELDIYSSPPSDAVDAAWQDLFGFGISQVQKHEAEQFANATMLIPGSDTQYVVLLDVFHELHCLNKIRMALYPQYYYNTTDPMDSKLRALHLTHCLNSIRQSVQCSSDISTIVWHKPEGEREVPSFDVLHSCRDFSKIQDWAQKNRAQIVMEDGRLKAAIETDV